MLGQEVMHQRCTSLDERGSSVADLFPSWERLSEEKQAQNTSMAVLKNTMQNEAYMKHIQ
jgi:hypothetical protein